MNDIAQSNSMSAPAAHAEASSNRYRIPVIVFSASLLLFAVAMSGSFYNGRLAAPITHDDVNFFIDGIQHLNLLRTEGFFALANDFLHGSMHAPISTYQAMFAYLLFGITDWAPYASNLILVIVFLAFAAYLLQGASVVALIGAMACLIAMPLSANTITEFNPELVCSLFTAIGAVLIVKLPVLDAPLRSRLLPALCFSLSFLAHPVAAPFTLIALLASIGVGFFRDVVWSGKLRCLPTGIGYSLLNVFLCVCLPALYVIFRYHEYATYFYDAVFSSTSIWSPGEIWHFGFYLFGQGGQFMFGRLILVYAGIVSLGLLAAFGQKDRRVLGCQIELLVLAFVFWLVPSISPTKAYHFASAFGFLTAFLTVLALRSIHNVVRGSRGDAVVLALGVLLLVLYTPTGTIVSNLPETRIDGEFAFRALDQMRAVLLGNATNNRRVGRATEVYMTNIGAYAPNMLWYYLLKEDPALHWNFDAKWMDGDPLHHIDFILASQADFVIAGERANGLTYSEFAAPAEDAVLAAMWHDPQYMAIDSFYGPKGRTVAIFQRRGNFAGWRPIYGLVNNSPRRDDPRSVPDGVAFLQTFAAHAIEADLLIDWVGGSTRQKISVFVNYQKVAESTSEDGQLSSIRQKINLSKGNNDIVLQSDHPLTLRYLVIVPNVDQFARPERDVDLLARPKSSVRALNPGISVVSATYGSNCDAPSGNATQALVASCNGKEHCAYPIHVQTLGDPASGCAKNFTVSYFCLGDADARIEEVAPEAGFGKVVDMNCAPERTGAPTADVKNPH
jgi:hypothetical protein